MSEYDLLAVKHELDEALEYLEEAEQQRDGLAEALRTIMHHGCGPSVFVLEVAARALTRFTPDDEDGEATP